MYISRWKRGDAEIRLTPRDVDVLRVLQRYRYLPSNFIHSFIGGNVTGFSRRLKQLYWNKYIERPFQQQMYVNANYRHLTYALDKKGRKALADAGYLSEHSRVLFKRGRDDAHREFAHDLMICSILASVELGASEFVSWQDMLDKAPRKTQEARHPLTIPVGSKRLTPDGVFGLKVKKGYRFFALEADRNNMPIRRSQLRQSSYYKKLLSYKEVIDQQIYKAHFGIPNFLYLTVTTNETHMENIMSVLEKEFPAKYHPLFLFKTMASLGDYIKPPEPTPHMLSEPWKRVGNSDFYLEG